MCFYVTSGELAYMVKTVGSPRCMTATASFSTDRNINISLVGISSSYANLGN